MAMEGLVSAAEFCSHYNIELSFIELLREHGLIETVFLDQRIFLPTSELVRLERIIRLHFELDINLEGIETIHHLLDRIDGMQKQISHLSKLLKLYEKLDTNAE